MSMDPVEPAALLVVTGVLLLISRFFRISGQTVMLKIIPVDPRNLFRGDYVILSYGFSLELPPDTSPESGLFLKGRINTGGRHEFGISQFFGQGGKGRVCEDAVRRYQLTAEVTIDRSGNGIPRRLPVND